MKKILLFLTFCIAISKAYSIEDELYTLKGYNNYDLKRVFHTNEQIIYQYTNSIGFFNRTNMSDYYQLDSFPTFQFTKPLSNSEMICGIAGSSDLKIKKIDNVTGKLTDVQSFPFSILRYADISDNGKYIYLVDGQFQGVVYDLTTGNKVINLNLFSSYYCSFSHDSKYLTVVTTNCIVIHDLEKQEIIQQIDVPHKDGDKAVLSNDDRYLFKYGSQTKLSCWDTKTGEQINDFYDGWQYVTSILFTDDNKYAIITSDSLRIWDLETKKVIGGYGANFIPLDVFYENGKLFGIADHFGYTTRFDVYAGSHTDTISISHSLNDEVLDGQYFTDGNYSNGDVKLRNTLSGKIVQSCGNLYKFIFRWNIPGTENYLVVDSKGQFFIYNVLTDEKENFDFRDYWKIDYSITAVSSDKKNVFCSHNDSIFIYNSQTKQLHILGNDSWIYNGSLFSNSSKYLAFPCSTKTKTTKFNVIETEGNKEILNIETERSDVAYTFSSDEKMIFVNDEGRVINAYDLESGQLVFSLPAIDTDTKPDKLFASADGKYLYEINFGNGIFVWSLEKKTLVKSYNIYYLYSPVYYSRSNNCLILNINYSSITVLKPVIPTSAEDNTSLITETSIKLYPNPAESTIYMDLPEEITGNIDLSICNSLGNEISRRNISLTDSHLTITPEEMNINTSGLYYVKLRNEKGINFTKTFVFVR